jgi:hypothetical protein
MIASESGPAAEPDGAQTASAQPRARRVHRFLVPTLLVLATIFGITGAFAVWVNRQALNTSNWASTSGKILENNQVQTALSAYLVRQLFTNVNVSADLKQVLPAQLQPLAGPAAAGLQDLAGTLAPKVLASPQVQAAWVQANIAAHKELLKVLNGGGPVVSSKSGVVTLNVHRSWLSSRPRSGSRARSRRSSQSCRGRAEPRPRRRSKRSSGSRCRVSAGSS